MDDLSGRHVSSYFKLAHSGIMEVRVHNLNGKKEGRLFIIDDFFPHPYSVDSWRGTEFHAYLDTFYDSNVFTTLSSINTMGTLEKNDVMDIYNRKYPQYKNRIICFEDKKLSFLEEADMAYFVFLNNAWIHLEAIEKYKIPFVFELYPGGGFAIDNEVSDRKMEQVMKSHYFRGVIVSNSIIYQYIVNHKLCDEKQISLITGCVLNNQSWQRNILPKKYYKIDKETFDIAFASYRYSKYGIDKGYDTFIEVSKILHKISGKFRFHVIGNFDSTILDVSELDNSIQYYGVHETDWFNSFYQNIDVLISPNKSSILSNGSFDGFPTGCGVDALIRKVVLIASDELGQNNGQYHNGKDIYIVKNSPQIIVDRILFLFEHPHILMQMGKNGHERARKLYSNESQIEPRIEFVNLYLSQNPKNK